MLLSHVDAVDGRICGTAKKWVSNWPSTILGTGYSIRWGFPEAFPNQ